MNSVADLINTAAVRRLAGARSYERGVGYFYGGRVEQPIERDGPSDTELRAQEAPALRAPSRRGRASVGTSAPKLSNWIRRIDRAFFGHGEFVSYYEAEAWADGIYVMVEHLENLCDAGHPDAVVELAEHAFGCADEAINYVDDSDGHLTGIIERLSELHLRACTEGSAEGDELAARLVKLELRSELDGFHRAAARYADVLGESGLAEHRRLLEPRWHAIKPTDDPYGAAFRIRQAMVGWALATGDPEAIIEAQATEIIDRKRPDHYRDAVDLMERIRRLADTAGEPERFTSFLRQVRTDHRLKRRLMAELDQRSWD